MWNTINLNELIDYYYYAVGYDKTDDCSFDFIKNVLQYLVDCNLNKEEIISVIDECGDTLSFDNLPERLWSTSLLNKNQFYIHRALKLSTISTVVDIFSNDIVQTNPAIEMKIQYTYDDIFEYYIEAFEIDPDMLNYKKEIASFKYIIELCEKQYSYLNAIDILLFLIDNAANSSATKIYNVLELQQYLYDTVIYLKTVNDELTYSGNNKIIWRK